jgi:hypothetical protein
MAAKNSAAAQEHAAKKRAQLERARQIKEARAAAAAAAAGGGGGGGVGGGGAITSSSRGGALSMDLGQRVASNQPLAQAPGQHFGLDTNGRGHVDAYSEYKQLVGDADNGKMFSPDE